MTWSLLFFTTNIFLGIGLAMDAFSVSMANGLNEPHMNKGRVCTIAGVFGGFQALMPLIGWFCVHTIAEYFQVFEKFIPWIALILLLFIGGKMLIEGIKNDYKEEVSAVSPGALFVQGIATSIDALSVGFTIAEYNWIMALAASLIIAIVTFFILILFQKHFLNFGISYILCNPCHILCSYILSRLLPVPYMYVQFLLGKL